MNFVRTICMVSCVCACMSIPVFAAHGGTTTVSAAAKTMQAKQEIHTNVSKQPSTTASKETSLRDYDPAKDAAPKEPFPVVETNFTFHETLLEFPMEIHQQQPFTKHIWPMAGPVSAIITSFAKMARLNEDDRWQRSVPMQKGRIITLSALM